MNDLVTRLLCTAKRCSDRKMQTGNGGNLSARIAGEDLMIIKASKIAFYSCKPEGFVVSDFDGRAVEGARKPSRESILHGAIYKKLAHIGAIVHCHSPWAIAWASAMQPLPFSTYHSHAKLKTPVEVFDTGSYTVPPEKVAQILDSFDSQPEPKAFLLKGHGLVALGENIEEAADIAELVEETAQIAIIERLCHAARVC